MTSHTEEVVSEAEAKRRGYDLTTFNMIVHDPKHGVVRIRRDGYYERVNEFTYLGDYK